MTNIEKANNFIENIKAATVGKRGIVTATYTEGEQIYYICATNDGVVDQLIIEEGRETDDLNEMFTRWAKTPIFITPNLKSFETFTER